jgi:hypothetical protein
MDKETLKKMTVAELREQAKKIPDIKGISSMKKDELVELLTKTGPEEKTKPSKKEKAAKEKAETKVDVAPDKSEIKKRIRELKTDKLEALSKDDRTRARECNRQIHRYKRQLRKMGRAKTKAKKK